jgi:hypothetical protein
MQHTKTQTFLPSRRRSRAWFLLGLAFLLVFPAWAAADAASPSSNPSDPDNVYPSQVILASFAASSADGEILVAWNTETELFNSGFNLYRSVHATNQFVRVNDDLIPSLVQQGPGSAAYEFADGSVTVGTTYDYWLESIDFQALPTYQGLITVEAAANHPPQMAHRVFLPFVVNH